MATTGVFNGTDLIVNVDGNPIGHSTSFTFSMANDLPDASSRDSAGWAEHIRGQRSGSISFDGLIDYSDEGTTQEGVVTLADLIINRTAVTVTFGTVAVGDTVFSASASLDSLEQSADSEQTATYSGSFTINGAITTSVTT